MNICKRQTFIGKKYLTFKKKYLRILAHVSYVFLYIWLTP